MNHPLSAIAIDLGATKCAGALISKKGEVLNTRYELLDGKAGTDAGDLINDIIHDLLEQAGHDKQTVQGVGISVPGISYQDKGTVWAPNISGWEAFPLLQHVETSFPQLKSSIKIDSDRACSVLGEEWKGSARGAKNVVFLAVGSGIGAGILIDGKVLRGNSDIAGAIGWMALSPDFKEGYKTFGCFEYHAAGDGLVRVANELSKDSSLRLKASVVFSAYEKGDPIAIQVIEQAIRFWGMAAANLVSLFNPEKIIFGGGVFGPAQQFINDIYQEARRWAQPISIREVEFTGSELGSEAALYGAGRLVFHEIK